MINLLKYKWLYFTISFLVILPGLYALARYGLKLSIDFTGGTLLEMSNERLETRKLNDWKDFFESHGTELASVQRTNAGTVLFKTKPMDESKKAAVVAMIEKDFGTTGVERFETVGPVVGKELAIRALQAVVLASVAIVLYIAYAFRKIPKPYSSWKFGVSAVVALLHDALVLLGLFAILGKIYGVEVDALFVTALLTVIGFSVHDTIVVFDRVRENLIRSEGKRPFEEIVNESLVQTLVRSLNTSLTVLLVLFALILFGGESIRWFVVALFVGVFSGTYSSIFNAAPLLVIWERKRGN